MGEDEFGALLLIQNFEGDQFFSIDQKHRLSSLMDMWRTARDEGQLLPEKIQAELDSLVEAELKAATSRTASLLQQPNQ